MEDDQKFLKLLELLGIYQELGSIIVFVDKQENADILLKDLMKAAYNCMSLHGGIDQFDRDSTIIDFKSGKVTHVLDYKLLNLYKAYQGFFFDMNCQPRNFATFVDIYLFWYL